jgi:hypothetical protein
LRNLLERRVYFQPKVARGGRLQRLAVSKDPQQPPDIPRVMEIVKKTGLEFLPPPRA